MLVPLQWGLMDGAASLEEFWNSIAIQVALATVLVVGCIRIPEIWVRDFEAPYVVVLLVWQVASFVLIASRQPTDSISEVELAQTASASLTEDRPNIDHWKKRIEEMVFKAPPVPVQENVMSKQKWYELDEFSSRLHALLLIKPPNSAAVPLRFSQEVSQLADIPATVFQVLGPAPAPNDGHSVFALDEVKGRDISVLAGVVDKNAIGRRVRPRRGISRTSLGHLGYNPDRGWTNHE